MRTARQFETDIWQAGWDVFRRNLLSVAIATGVMLPLDMTLDYMKSSGSSRTVADLFIWSFVAISMHGTVLSDKTDVGLKDGRLLMPFVWRSLALMALVMLPTVFALFYLYEEEQFGVTLLKVTPVACIAALVVFGFLGTCLPAVVGGGDRRFAAAFARGRQTFTYVAPRLLWGPGVIFLCQLTVIGIFATQDLINADLVGKDGLNFVDIVLSLAIYASRCFSLALLAVVLSRAYLMSGEGADEMLQGKLSN
jgi:hypothetical protein